MCGGGGHIYQNIIDFKWIHGGRNVSIFGPTVPPLLITTKGYILYISVEERTHCKLSVKYIIEERTHCTLSVKKILLLDISPNYLSTVCAL
jgi:hypothetical protein